MSATTTLHLRLMRGVVAITAGCAVLLTVACGGGGGGGILSGGTTPAAQASTPSGAPDEREAKAAVNKVYSDFVAMLSNARPPSDFIADFTAACRQDVSLSKLQAGIDAFRKDNPGVVAKKMDGVDFGNKVTVVKRDDGFDVNLAGTRDATLRVDGKPAVAHEYFVQQGLEKDSEGSSGSRVRLVNQGGKLLVSDCGQLKGVADYKPSSPASRTPTPTPTAKR